MPISIFPVHSSPSKWLLDHREMWEGRFRALMMFEISELYWSSLQIGELPLHTDTGSSEQLMDRPAERKTCSLQEAYFQERMKEKD